MIRLIKLVLILLVLGLLTVTGYSFLGDLSPPEAEVRREVIIDVE
jgi:hypothetical protein